MIHNRVSEGLRCLGLEPLEGLTGNLKVRPEMLDLRQLDFKYADCGLSCAPPTFLPSPRALYTELAEHGPLITWREAVGLRPVTGCSGRPQTGSAEGPPRAGERNDLEKPF